MIRGENYIWMEMKDMKTTSTYNLERKPNLSEIWVICPSLWFGGTNNDWIKVNDRRVYILWLHIVCFYDGGARIALGQDLGVHNMWIDKCRHFLNFNISFERFHNFIDSINTKYEV